jgi:uncharacterized damage-inducible protein DinB
MTEIERIEQQLNAAFNGGAWHGPSVFEAIDGVTAAEAAARPVDGAHTIHELVAHIGGWTDVIRRRVDGEAAEEPAEGDWPEIHALDDEGWRAAVDQLRSRYDKLVSTLQTVDVSRLDRPVYEGASSVYATLHGAIQHAIYHAGQIAILKKAARERANSAPA